MDLGPSDLSPSDGGPRNRAPIIRWLEDGFIPEGAARCLDVDLSDPDGDALVATTTVTPGFEVQQDVPDLCIRSQFGVREGTVTVVATDPSGAQARSSLELTVSPFGFRSRKTWTENVNGPEAREHPAVMAEPNRRRFLVLHGSGYRPQFEQMLDDAWAFDIDTLDWTPLRMEGEAPTGLGSRRPAGPNAEGEWLVFGGYGNGQPRDSGDLFRLTVSEDAVRWEEVEQRNPPPARSLHAFAYNPGTDQYVLFGGVQVGSTSFSVFRDVWTMQLVDGTAEWTSWDLPGPSARYGMFYGMDTQDGRLVVFSGAQRPTAESSVNPAEDTWALDIESLTWTRWSDEGSGGPAGRRNGSAAWDDANQRLFVFGGTPDARTNADGLWVLDARTEVETAERWHELDFGPAPLRSSGFGISLDGEAFIGFGNGPRREIDVVRFGYPER